MFRRQISKEITLIISMVCHFTTKSDGIWIFLGKTPAWPTPFFALLCGSVLHGVVFHKKEGCYECPKTEADRHSTHLPSRSGPVQRATTAQLALRVPLNASRIWADRPPQIHAGCAQSASPAPDARQTGLDKTG